ncbi:aldehyde dehydrogenase family protein [Streptosporangium sp. NPDC002544]|uniref:aldehyde dehydrogenase family protein n=1 Tax=unclassified Streptosporangium TaxID=2632669 RepID=UPI003320D794
MSAVAATPLPAFLSGPAKQLFIDGAWRPAASGATFTSINPSTGRPIVEVAAGDAADIDAAVAAARRAFTGPWSRFTPVQRQNVLLKLADLLERHQHEIGLINVVDMGVPVSKQRGGAAVETLRYFAGWATKLHGETIPNSFPGRYFSYTVREPIGVAGAITPWNSPLPATIWKIAPALATGCTIVLKPAEEASLTPLRIGELIAELDLPPGVVNIVTGYGETAGAALAAHPDVDKIGFTGSSETGRAILRSSADSNLKRISLELGGKSPDIIFADADLGAAIPAAAEAVFGNSGQICVAGTRIFVERPVYDEVLAGVARYADALAVGDSLDPTTEIGPLVSQAQLDRVSGYLELGRAEGAATVAGGARLTDGALADGYFVAPTVLADVRDDMRVVREEIFGPVASVLPFDDVDEVVQRANNTSYGLAGGLWTRDLARAHTVAQALQTGMVWVNGYGAVDPAVPFGGAKTSGWGNELSGEILHEYLNVKSIWINTGA